MQFNSFEYWIFFALVCALLAVAPAYARRLVVVVASYVFYSFWDPRFAALLLASTLVNYVLGIQIESAAATRRKMFVTLAVAVNLAVLGFFKYFNFFEESLEAMLHLESHAFALHIALPVGISFFTFEGIAYCVDIYRKDIRAVRNLTDFALFISFFPHLVAGPIIRPENFFPQLRSYTGLTPIDVKWGSCQVVKGLIKKIVFADFFAVTANLYFDDPLHGGVAPAVGVVAFALQIYFDFAGYTDIARGCAALMGVRFPSNFERPYLAVNIADFWRRWHISLSSWLRDYLYIPLGGNRCGAARVYLNLMIVMALGGLWHGASWNFMVWGATHGGMLCVHRLWSRHVSSRYTTPRALRPFATIVCTALTFICVVVAWVPFRSTDFGTTSIILRQLISSASFSAMGATSQYWWLLGISAGWCAIDWNRRAQIWFVERMPYALAGVPIGLALVAIELFGQFDLHIPFIYFKF